MAMLFYNLLRVQKLAHETKKNNLVNLLSASLNQGRSESTQFFLLPSFDREQAKNFNRSQSMRLENG